MTQAQNNDFLAFAFTDHQHLVSGAAKNLFETSRYANGELTMQLHADVTGKTCAVVGSIAPPDENLASFLGLAYTLKKEGAAKVAALLPYLAYAREDKDEPGKSCNTALIGQLMEAVGVDEVLTIDVHSQATAGLFPVPLRSFEPSQIWAREIAELKQTGITIAAPDRGAINRCTTLARAAQLPEDVTYIGKHRVDGIVHENLEGPVTPSMIIIDDILDTGKTLASCAQRLKQNGAQSITAAVTHALFTGGWEQIWDAGIQKLYCLDTTPAAKNQNHPKVQVISCSQLISEMLAEL